MFLNFIEGPSINFPTMLPFFPSAPPTQGYGTSGLRNSGLEVLAGDWPQSLHLAIAPPLRPGAVAAVDGGGSCGALRTQILRPEARTCPATPLPLFAAWQDAWTIRPLAERLQHNLSCRELGNIGLWSSLFTIVLQPLSQEMNQPLFTPPPRSWNWAAQSRSPTVHHRIFP